MIKIIDEIVNVGTEDVASKLSALSVPSSIGEALGVVAEKKEELVEHYKKQLTDYSKKTLLDFNYTVKVIMSSDSSSVVKIPVVNIELFIKDVNNLVERVVLELNKEELKTFIDQLALIEKVSIDIEIIGC